jgi:hypothetical protein
MVSSDLSRNDRGLARPSPLCPLPPPPLPRSSHGHALPCAAMRCHAQVAAQVVAFQTLPRPGDQGRAGTRQAAREKAGAYLLECRAGKAGRKESTVLIARFVWRFGGCCSDQCHTLKPYQPAVYD